MTWSKEECVTLTEKALQASGAAGVLNDPQECVAKIAQRLHAELTRNPPPGGVDDQQIVCKLARTLQSSMWDVASSALGGHRDN